jgi:hypothetical protein
LARHYQALQRPRGFESAIALMRESLLLYGCEYEARYGEDSRLGQDGVIGEAWLDMARGYLALLNGETGRLDCGTLDGELRRWAERFGFEEEL